MSTSKIDFKYLIENQKTISRSMKKEQEAKIIEYDYKIVSFKIGEEYYGIDIMKVKEILKEKKFTRVPNTLDFVTGVLNLRGEIMPVVDLAVMFHLESKRNNDDMRSIIIIKVEGLIIGLIVDQIQHVIPIRKSDIQPPSPLLGSINERYIEGVIELNDRLYVIIDTDAIFSDKEKSKKNILPQNSDLSEEFFVFFCNQVEQFCAVHRNDINDQAFRQVFVDYMKSSQVQGMPTINQSVAELSLNRMLSAHTGEFWDKPYIDHFTRSINECLGKWISEEVRILIVGCGSGHEAFSVYFLINQMFHDAQIRMIAADMNLTAVSNASGFEVKSHELPSWINKGQYFVQSGSDGLKVKKEVNESIYFEFHNAVNITTYKKEFDLVIARDLSFYLSENDYKSFIQDLIPKIVSGGVLLIGDHENLPASNYLNNISNSSQKLYLKK